MSRCGSRAVWVLGETRPVVSVGYDKPTSRNDSGFTVLFVDAPDLNEVPKGSDSPVGTWWCLHCLLDEYPAVGRGLDVARRWGAADLGESGEWVGRHVEPEA